MGNAVVCKIRTMAGANDKLNSEFERTIREYQQTARTKSMEELKQEGYEVEETPNDKQLERDLANIKDCL
eukprot:m.14754 g.14754  ORF g.14754 m.14754 type:complete len:70 (+) comp7759_c0_seq1:195-404(+)